MSWQVKRIVVMTLIVGGMTIGETSAQTQATLPTPSESRQQPQARTEVVPARRAWPRRAWVRSRRAPVAPAPLPAPDSDLAKAFINSKPAPQPPKTPQPPLATMMLQPPANSAGTPAPYATKININQCTLEQLQSLPGVGAAMGGHIMAGRPYRTIGDLARMGVPLDTIQKIAPLIVMGP